MVSFITITLVVVGVLCTLAQRCTDGWDHIIYVDHAATDMPTCGSKSYPCGTFNTALKKLNHNSTAICLGPGTYNLTNGNHTHLLYKSNIAIIGSSEDTVTVQCSPLTGLSFIQSSNITLQSLILRKCGALQISSSRKLDTIFAKFQVSLYMLYCTNVCISNVTIESSNGTGLTLYNTVGTVTIQYCTFNNNGVLLDKSSVGGGGLQIQFTYCTPGDSSCNKISPYYRSNARYNIIFNVFTGNIAHSTEGTLNNDNILLGRGGAISIALEGHSFNNIFNLLGTNITKGNRAQAGGGIYLALHNAQDNHININKCHITDTMATKDGGGMYIKLGDSIATVIKNNISISENIIEHNKAMVKGGGVFLSINSEVFISKNNIIMFHDSSFSNNRAQGGAAMYLYSLIDNSMVRYLQISNVKFFNNTVTASFLSCPGTICIYKLQVIFSGSVILTSNHVSAIKLYNAATLVLDDNSHCIFESNIGNEGGAIALYNCSTIVLQKNTNLTFSNNSANIGGAIYSGECSLPMCFIQPHVIPEAWNVQLHFYYNKAHKYGNATYIGSNVVSCWPPNVDCSSLSDNVEIISKTFCWNTTWHYSPGNCYSNVDTSIVYYKSSVPVYYVYPGDELRLKLEFYDGQMKLSDSYYETLNFCIHGPASFNDAANVESNCYYTTDDEYVYYYCPELKPVQNCSTYTLTQDGSLSLYFAPNNNEDKCINSNISLTINPVQCSLSGNVVVRFKICPFGFDGPLCLDDNPSCVYDSSITYYHSQCFVIQENSHIRCPGDESKDMLTQYGNCKQATLCGIGSTITTEEGYCLFQYDNGTGTNIGIGMCPSGYANTAFTAVFSDLISPDFESYQPFCSDGDNSIFFNGVDHTGRLCGNCSPGTAVPITGTGILPCINCSSSEADGLVLVHVFPWYYILPLQFLPLTIMIVLIIVLDIKLVGGHITGYILYCQMLSLPLPQLFLSTVVIPFISMWNINFISMWDINFIICVLRFCSICITHTMGALGAISFWYVVAFYPLVLLLLLYVWIIMYERGWRMVVCITQPVHRLLARFWLKFDIHPSLIDSVAGIYILCFTQLAVTSLKILHFTRWESLTSDEYGLAFYYDGTLDYFKGYHALAGSFAIIVLIIFVILPMVYLLLYPFKYFQRFLDVCKLRRQFTDAVVDSLTGSLKNGSDNTYDYRFFAGLYLLLRIIIICLFYIPYTDHEKQYFAFCGAVVVHGGAVTIFRPFRKNLHNFSNFILTVFLALNFGLLLTSSMLNSLTLFILFLIICNSPCFLVLVYCIYKIVKKCRCKCKTNRQPHAPIHDDDDNDELSPLLQQQNANSDFDADRMMNPDNYEERHFSNPWLQAQLWQAEHKHEDPVSRLLSQHTADCDSNGSQSDND